MYNDIDMVLFHDTEVGLGLERSRASEHDVLQIGPDHRATPPICQRTSCTLFHQILVILVNPHMGPVQDLDDLTINREGFDTLFFPFVLERLRSAFQVAEGTTGLAEFSNGGFCYTQGNLVEIAVHSLTINFNRCGYIKVGGNLDQSCRILDGVILGFFPGYRQKCLGNGAAMIRMRCCAGCDHTNEVTGTYGVSRGTAKSLPGVLSLYPTLGERQAAWPHRTVFTANSLQTNSTGLHGYRPVKDGLDLQLLCPEDHLLG